MNTKGLEAMVPKMIDEAEEYFREWGNEGEVRRADGTDVLEVKT